MRRPSTSRMCDSPPIVPVVKASSAVYSSVKDRSASTAGIPMRAATSSTIDRVKPGRQATGNGVINTPERTTKILVALVSAMKPLTSNMTASSTPATLASIFASMLLSRLLWWILESKVAGELRRVEAVTSRVTHHRKPSLCIPAK